METLIEMLKSSYAWTSSTVVSGAPKIAAVAVVVVVGVLLARIVRAALHHVLGFLRFDSLANRIGVSDVLKRAEVEASAREILGTIVYWTLLIFTAMVSLGVLGLATPETFAEVGAMIPKVLIATAILILGLPSADRFRRSYQNRLLRGGCLGEACLARIFIGCGFPRRRQILPPPNWTNGSRRRCWRWRRARS